MHKCKIRDRNAVHLLTAYVDAILLDTNEYIINQTSIKKLCEHFRKQTSEDVNSKFHEQNKPFVIIHWYSKILPDLTG